MDILRLFSAGFALSAVYHAAGLANPAWTEPSPAWRHALFAGINAAAVFGLWRYRRAYLPAFALLVAQQVVSHGLYARRVWLAEGRADWASVAVLLFMPVLLATLLNPWHRPWEQRS